MKYILIYFCCVAAVITARTVAHGFGERPNTFNCWSFYAKRNYTGHGVRASHGIDECKRLCIEAEVCYFVIVDDRTGDCYYNYIYGSDMDESKFVHDDNFTEYYLWPCEYLGDSDSAGEEKQQLQLQEESEKEEKPHRSFESCWMLRGNRRYSGHGFNMAGSLDECKHLCFMTVHCYIVVLNNRTGECHYNVIDAQQLDQTHFVEDGDFSEYHMQEKCEEPPTNTEDEECEQQFCWTFYANRNYTGSGFERGPSLDECKKTCFRVDPCYIVILNTATGDCYHNVIEVESLDQSKFIQNGGFSQYYLTDCS